MAKKVGTTKKKVVKVDPVGQAHIHASFNNIIISMTNSQGQVISLKDQRRTHPMLLRLLQLIAPKLHSILDYGKSRYF
jgi:hypothetical protein